jgi:GDP-D-mannose dehydratase
MIPTYNPHARRTKAGSPSSRTDARFKSHAVRDWIEACFREAGLDWNDYTETDRTYASPYRRLVSDPAKLLSLGWKPECTFSGLAAMMMAEAARRCEVYEQKADGS